MNNKRAFLESNYFTNIVNSMADGVYIVNSENRIEYINAAVKKDFGDIKNRRCFEYFYGRKRKCPWCKFNEVRKGKTIRWEWHSPKANKIYDVIETPLKKPDGSISKLKILRDITDYKRIIQDIAEKTEKIDYLSKFPTENPLPVMRVRKNGTLLFNNIASIPCLGEWHYKKKRKLPAKLINSIKSAFKSGKITKVEMGCGGRTFEYFITPLRKERYVNLYGYDITDRKKAESDIKKARNDFERLLKERTVELGDKQEELSETQSELVNQRRLSDIGRLASNIAHELRSPLGVIEITSFNLERRLNDKAFHKYTESIQKQVAECNQIINNLLAFARMKEPSIKKVNIYDILEESVAAAKKRVPAEKTTIRKAYRELKDVCIFCDRLQIKEVFVNIINNAYQACENKSKGRIGITGKKESNGTIRVDFKDRGIGISQEDISKIFEPFFTKKVKGTGLGLSISKELINSHKGTIAVESKRKKGTTFTVRLPLKRSRK
jgi:signal transduction histidine kinase